MPNREIFNIRSNWSNAVEYKNFLEGLFLRTECGFRKELDIHSTGSTALAMRVCEHKKHPYAHTQFPKKCIIELCPIGDYTHEPKTTQKDTCPSASG